MTGAEALPLLFIFIAAFYFLPTVIGYFRKHHNLLALFALNFLLGWTLLGWVASIVWSLTRNPTTSAPVQTS